MFFDENQMNEVVICPNCRNKFSDPRIVECSSSFCMSCVEFLIQRDENGFKCPVCKDFHEKPQKGWTKNHNLAKLCEKIASEVSRGSPAAILKHQLDLMKSNLDELANKNKLCIERINEHCGKLRNEVELSSEVLVEKLLKEFKMELIGLIDNYEKKSLTNFNKAQKAEFDGFIKENYAFHGKWIDYLKQFKLDDEKLKTAADDAKKYTEHIRTENEQVLDKVFNGNVLQFEKNSTQFTSSLVGSLSFRNTDFKSKLFKFFKFS